MHELGGEQSIRPGRRANFSAVARFITFEGTGQQQQGRPTCAAAAWFAARGLPHLVVTHEPGHATTARRSGRSSSTGGGAGSAAPSAPAGVRQPPPTSDRRIRQSSPAAATCSATASPTRPAPIKGFRTRVARDHRPDRRGGRRRRQPDVTLLFDLPAADARRRGLLKSRRRASAADRLDVESLAFYERVRAGYLELAAVYPPIPHHRLRRRPASDRGTMLACSNPSPSRRCLRHEARSDETHPGARRGRPSLPVSDPARRLGARVSRRRSPSPVPCSADAPPPIARAANAAATVAGSLCPGPSGGEATTFHPDFFWLVRDLKTSISAGATRELLRAAQLAPRPGTGLRRRRGRNLGGGLRRAAQGDRGPSSGRRAISSCSRRHRLDLSPTLRSRSLAVYLGARREMSEELLATVAAGFRASAERFAAGGGEGSGCSMLPRGSIRSANAQGRARSGAEAALPATARTSSASKIRGRRRPGCSFAAAAPAAVGTDAAARPRRRSPAACWRFAEELLTASPLRLRGIPPNASSKAWSQTSRRLTCTERGDRHGVWPSGSVSRLRRPLRGQGRRSQRSSATFEEQVAELVSQERATCTLLACPPVAAQARLGARGAGRLAQRLR